MTVYKMCSDCFTPKPIEQFHTDKTGAAMVRGNCKSCECVKRKLRYYRAKQLRKVMSDVKRVKEKMYANSW